LFDDSGDERLDAAAGRARPAVPLAVGESSGRLKFAAGGKARPPVEPHSPGSFLYWARTKWREQGNDWEWFFPAPLTLYQPPGLLYDKHDYFMSEVEWQDIQSALAKNDEPSIGYSFIVDAQERYRQGDKRFAVVQLNAALERAAREFVVKSLATGAGVKSASQASGLVYAALLKKWVLPLAAKQGIGLTGTKEWQDVFEIKDRRNEVAHPTPSGSFPPLTDEMFFGLVGSAVRVMTTLLGVKPPRRPGPFYMGCDYDELPEFFRWQ
jgi:hypothetical protein